MACLLDSDWLIDHLEDLPETTRLLTALGREPLYISIVSYMEAFQGVLRSVSPATAHARLQDFVNSSRVLPISLTVAEECARLREALRLQGGRVNQRSLDLLIAATAVTYGLTLVTRNVADFRDVPGLRLYEAPTAGA